MLRPQLGDFNEDLRRLGPARLAAWLRDQLVPEDARLHLHARLSGRAGSGQAAASIRTSAKAMVHGGSIGRGRARGLPERRPRHTSRSRPQRLRRPPLRFGLRCGRVRRAAGVDRQAAIGAATTDGETAMTYDLPLDDGYEPYHASSPTDRVILELQMYGHRPHQDEPDPRPLPDER